MSPTFTRNVFVTDPQVFVAVTVTVDAPTGNTLGELITDVPILYTRVGAGVPVTVTFGPKDTDALQLSKLVETIISVAVMVGALGAEMPVPNALAHPFTVLFTE